jgi:hypothetical protein
VDFGWPRVAFTAERDGVSFLCNDHLDPSGEARAPTSLAPGQSLVLESNLDCAMPLPGRYDVGVYVAFGGSARTDRGDLVRTFRLDVEEGSVVPRPYPSRPGLFVAMTGGQATPPLPPLAWARGDYHVVVAIVNDSSHPLEVGPAHLAFLTYKKGSPLPCAGQKEPVLFPEQLSPGSYKVVQAPVACAPSEEGTYDIIGRFTLDAVGEEIEIGRVSLKVNRDPPLFLPEPWPSHAPIPSEGTTAPAGDSTK